VLHASGGSIDLTHAIIPANGSCTVTVTVSASQTGSYTNTIAAQALTTGPAGASGAASTASLKVQTPPSSGGGGGALGNLELMLLGGIATLGARRRAGRRATPPRRQPLG